MKIRPDAALVHLMQSVVLAFIATSFSSGRCFAQDQVENNTLAALIKSNQFDAASEALKSGANVNAQLPDGMTALHWALQRQQNELVGQLLQSGADPNLTNHYGVPPLWITCC
ncbi:MAG: ankyrin repeat domain-containing protein, partial [Rubripirellula sp.]